MLSSDSRTDPPQPPVTMNPFDAVITTATQLSGAIQTGSVAPVTSSIKSSEAPSGTSHLDGAFLNTTPSLSKPMSPSRTSHPSSVNSSPVPTHRLGNNSVVISSPMPMASSTLAPEIPGLVETDGVLLGLQQLERQQAELERRRRVQPSASSTPSTSSPAQRRQPDDQHYELIETATPGFPDPAVPTGDSFVDDDEDTEPSSTGAVSEDREGVMVTSQSSHLQNTTTFGRMIQNTKLRLISAIGHERQTDADEEEDLLEGAFIAGYLQKLGRNGKWQKRWFESDGQWLSYYKTEQRVKLLATLDLEKVGRISMNDADSSGRDFSIQVSSRPYHLRAESKASCKDWVITLNRVKEARMQQGNVMIETKPPLRDLLDRNESDDFGTRIVVVANRQRTRAVDQESWEEVVGVTPNTANASDSSAITGPSPISPHPRLTQVVFTSWKKRRSVFSKMATKLLRWARSLRQLTCSDIDEEPVVLDQHVHPPGHDEVHINRAKRSGNSSATASKDSGGGSSDRPDLSPSSNHSIASTTTSDPRELA